MFRGDGSEVPFIVGAVKWQAQSCIVRTVLAKQPSRRN